MSAAGPTVAIDCAELTRDAGVFDDCTYVGDAPVRMISGKWAAMSCPLCDHTTAVDVTYLDQETRDLLVGSRRWEPTGAELRDEGMDAVLAADVAINRGYADVVRRAIAEHAESGQTFTPDDVARRCAELAPDSAPHVPQVIGAVFAGQCAAGLIEPIGHGRSRRRSRHRSHHNTYRGTGDPIRAAVAVTLLNDRSLTSTEIARRTGVNRYRVGRIRKELGL